MNFERDIFISQSRWSFHENANVRFDDYHDYTDFTWRWPKDERGENIISFDSNNFLTFPNHGWISSVSHMNDIVLWDRMMIHFRNRRNVVQIRREPFFITSYYFLVSIHQLSMPSAVSLLRFMHARIRYNFFSSYVNRIIFLRSSRVIIDKVLGVLFNTLTQVKIIMWLNSFQCSIEETR